MPLHLRNRINSKRKQQFRPEVVQNQLILTKIFISRKLFAIRLEDFVKIVKGAGSIK